MTHTVSITRRALDDLHQIYEWIAIDVPNPALAWYHESMAAIHTLDRFPERCPLAPEAIEVGIPVRNLILGAYRVIFRVEDQVVVVLHVRNASREPAGPADLEA